MNFHDDCRRILSQDRGQAVYHVYVFLYLLKSFILQMKSQEIIWNVTILKDTTPLNQWWVKNINGVKVPSHCKVFATHSDTPQVFLVKDHSHLQQWLKVHCLSYQQFLQKFFEFDLAHLGTGLASLLSSTAFPGVLGWLNLAALLVNLLFSPAVQ